MFYRTNLRKTVFIIVFSWITIFICVYFMIIVHKYFYGVNHVTELSTPIQTQQPDYVEKNKYYLSFDCVPNNQTQKVFDRIYNTNMWGGGATGNGESKSGAGSTIKHA
eukprot:258001_1